MHEQRLTALLARVRDTLHNPGEAAAVGLGWAARRLFASFQHAFSMAIGKKTNPADRPSLADSLKCQSEVLVRGVSGGFSVPGTDDEADEADEADEVYLAQDWVVSGVVT